MHRALWLATLVGCAGATSPVARAPAPAPPPATTDSDPWFGASSGDDAPWIDSARETIRVGDVDLTLALRTWDGEGAALFVLAPDGSTRGAYRFAFGGNGGDLIITGRCVTRDWVVLTLRAEGWARGYRLDPGQSSCPASLEPARQRAIDHGSEEDPCEVPGSSEVSFAEIGIDATHVWLVSAASSDEPDRDCGTTRN